jgi:hypothetical protein
MINENVEKKSLNETYDRSAESYHDDSINELKEIYYQGVSDDYVEDTLEEETDHNENVMNAEFVTSTLKKL